MTAFLFPILLCSAFLTSVLSGTFGMAGGMVLMAIMLPLMSLPAAMIVHSSVQMVSNLWRCFLWRRHIMWSVLPPYWLGMVIGFSIAAAVSYVPDKAVVLILLGTLPLIAMILRKTVTISITNRYQAALTAVLLTFFHITGGVIGPLLDTLYNNAPFTRQQIVSTKAITQSVMHILRLVYYGILIPGTMSLSWPADVPLSYMPFLIAAAIAGTSAAAFILHRMNDIHFKTISYYIITVISVICLAQGIYLLAMR